VLREELQNAFQNVTDATLQGSFPVHVFAPTSSVAIEAAKEQRRNMRVSSRAGRHLRAHPNLRRASLCRPKIIARTDVGAHCDIPDPLVGREAAGGTVRPSARKRTFSCIQSEEEEEDDSNEYPEREIIL